MSGLVMNCEGSVHFIDVVVVWNIKTKATRIFPFTVDMKIGCVEDITPLRKKRR